MLNLSYYVEQIHSRLTVSELIGRDIKLSRKGHEFSGLCPFHHEKTPSFTINDHKRFYHCFGCGAHGDVITYVMQRQNLSFPEAVRHLADQVGITIVDDKKAPIAPPDLYKILEFACQWFETNLQRNVGEEARDYLHKRGFEKNIQQDFRLGFAPNLKHNQPSLYQTLIQQGFDKGLILKAGIVIETQDKQEIYDRFRGRLMFPIMDSKGRVIAFGGRVMANKPYKEGVAKYINSSETVIFHKGSVLYNYHQAAKQITPDNPPILVEGYCDVISLSQAGWKTALAPLGTAVTEQQLNLLWKRHSHPLLCFDGDQAGMRAAFRATERSLPFLKTDKSLKICYLPKGEDPDSLLRNQGVEVVKNVFKNAVNLSDSLWNSLISMTPPESLTTPELKANFQKQVLNLMTTIQDSHVRKFYELDFLQRLRQLWYKQNQPYKPNQGPLGNTGFSGPHLAQNLLKKNDLSQKILLATLINYPTLLTEVFEQFAQVEFQEKKWQDLKQAVLQYSLENLVNLKPALEANGFEAVLKELFDKDLHSHAPFLSLGNDPQTVLARWQEIWHNTAWKLQVKNDLQHAQDRAKKLLDDTAWNNMKALKTTLVPSV